MKRPFARLVLVALCWVCAVARANQVHVVQQTLVDGVATQLSDQVLETGSTYSTQTAPTRSGYIFTHWSSNQPEPIVNRDRHGRAKEVASYKVYAEMILSANYLPASQDKDADGLADGYEIYWYGTTDILPTSDTDGDGYTFAEEIAAGTNPLLAEDSTFGAVVWDEGETLQYNPENLAPYVIRSEPEGKLFATQSDYAKPGTVKTSPSVSKASGFAYWTLNGVRQADRHGRAKDSVSFTMTGEPIELIAVRIDNSTERELAYWYGPESGIAADSDTDNDGYTFAEEIAAGTNPILAEDSTFGAVVWDEGELVEYNPEALLPYIIRSEPDGKLFATQSATVKVGTLVAAPSVSKADGFAYWTLNGERLADRHGRAKDSVSFTMPKGEVELIAVCFDDATERELAYWYGPNSGLNSDSDTDGDGYTFAEEIAAGTNPILAEESTFGAVVWDDGETLEVNLQPFDQWQGAIIDNEYKQLFVSIWKKNDSVDFGAAVTPIIVDLNDDGLFDLVIILEDGRKIVYLNVGSSGNPEFKEVPWDDAWLAKLEATKVDVDSLTLDTPIINGLSYAMADIDKDGIVDLLASDSDGRIWYYKGFKDGEEVRYVLQHKVWGGSFPGFAAGLTIAAVDWDDDGDIDLVCGTEDGKLMLLNDPRSGRPTNVRAEAGATDVVLRWDANVNSRVRGYGIYRGASKESYDKIQNLWPLTQYRDQPNVLQDYYYRVTGKSRFYTAGNSTPVESESMPTDAVFVRFTPELWLNDTSSYTDEDVEVVVSVNNSVGIATVGFVLGFNYDAAVLEPKEVIADGLSAGMSFASNIQSGKWMVRVTSGELKTGSGILLKLKFHVKAIKNPVPTEVALTSAALKSSLGQPITIRLPQKAVIDIAEKALPSPVPAGVVVNVTDTHPDTLSTFEVPIRVTSTKTLKDFSAKVNYDASILEFKRAEGVAWNNGVITATGSVPNIVKLVFFAKDQHTVTKSEISLSNLSAHCTDNLDATITATKGTVYITDSNVPVAPVVSAALYHTKAKSGEAFKLPLGVNSVGALAELTVEIEWDKSLLTHLGQSAKMTFKCSGEYNVFNFDFKIAAIENLQATSWVKIKSLSAVGANGLPATIKSIAPDTAQIIVSREIGKYGPGDVDGDGKLTDTDLTTLVGYVSYLKMPAATKATFAKGYQQQYHVNPALSGSAAKAADVNCDGKVDAQDVTMLSMLVEEAKGIGK